MFSNIDIIPMCYKRIKALAAATCVAHVVLGNIDKESRPWSCCIDAGCRNDLQGLVWGPRSVCVSQISVGISVTLITTGNIPDQVVVVDDVLFVCLFFCLFTRIIKSHLSNL